MAVWELALLLFGVTYFMVNTVTLIMFVKTMNKMDGVFSKSITIMNKMMDETVKGFDEE